MTGKLDFVPWLEIVKYSLCQLFELVLQRTHLPVKIHARGPGQLFQLLDLSLHLKDGLFELQRLWFS